MFSAFGKGYLSLLKRFLFLSIGRLHFIQVLREIYLEKTLQELFWAHFFGCPYRSNGTKIHLGATLFGEARWMLFNSEMRKKHQWKCDILSKDAGHQPGSLPKMSLFHRCFSHILLVKTKYFVSPSLEHWLDVG